MAIYGQGLGNRHFDFTTYNLQPYIPFSVLFIKKKVVVRVHTTTCILQRNITTTCFLQRNITTAYVSTYSTSDSRSDISHVVSQLFDGHWTKGNSSHGAAAGSTVGSALLMPTPRKDPPMTFIVPGEPKSGMSPL